MNLIARVLALFLALNLYACKKDVRTPSSNDSSIIAPEPEPVFKHRIAILGSSTAAGFGVSIGDSAWVSRLKTQVLKDGKSVEFSNLSLPATTLYNVLPSGLKFSGRPVCDTSRNINKALAFNPTFVLINFPTNDIANGFTDEEIMRNYAIITDMLDSVKIPYLILGSQPRNFSDPTLRERLKSQNDRLVMRYGIKIDDFLEQLSAPTYFIKDIYSNGDGIHLNNQGHKLIFNTIYNNKVFKDAFHYK